MRITDLARKLGIKTEELRAKLPGFHLPTTTQEIENARAQEIYVALGGTPGASSRSSAPVAPKVEEPVREVMGFMFESDDEEAATAPAVTVEEDDAQDENDDYDDEVEEEKAFSLHPPASTEAARAVDETAPSAGVRGALADRLLHTDTVAAAPVAPKAPVAVAPAAPKKMTGFVRAETVDRSAARERWAAAKRASEKLLEGKKREETVVAKRAAKSMGRGTFVPESVTAAANRKQATLNIDKTKPKRKVQMGDAIAIREFGEKMGISPVAIVGALFRSGVMTNLNAMIDYDTASIVAEDFWVEVVRDTTAVSGEDLLKGNIKKLLEDDPKNLSPRPPIVAVMGHVDHGKTTLLDRIRKTNVVGGESGGITQHIGAYQVEIEGRKITFLDTPGHEAFTAMRARGASATDIAILVVAANEGVKPQTIEALNHAKDAGVPIIVALTKVDLPDTQIDRVKGELAEQGLQPTDWGGSVEMIPVSGKTGAGVDTLLESILLVHDISPALANPKRPAVGTVIEAHLDKSLGPVATILVNTGTLTAGKDFIIGPVCGRVKRMWDCHGTTIKEALPGTPVGIAGLTSLPDRAVGQILQVFDSSAAARAKADEFAALISIQSKKQGNQIGLLMSKIHAGEIKELKIVLKADAEGSLEALRASIEKIRTGAVRPKIIHAGVGAVTETDVLMASAADGLIFAFHTPVPAQTERAADMERVNIRKHTIIYKMLEEIEKLMTGLLDPEEITVEVGELEVLAVFLTEAADQIIGGKVKIGVLQNGLKYRVMRGGKEIGEGKIISLKRDKDPVKEVTEGHECGLKVTTKKMKIAVGDVLQGYRVEKRKIGE